MMAQYHFFLRLAIPARNGVTIDFSVPSAFLVQVAPKSIPTPDP